MNTNKIKHILTFKDECFAIVGACMAVHNELGSAFLEPVYQEALSLEFQKRSIPFSKEHRLEIYYKEALLEKKYYADFLCYDQIVVELKACSGLNEQHMAQALNYLSALKLKSSFTCKFRNSKTSMEKSSPMTQTNIYIRTFVYIRDLSFVNIRGRNKNVL